MNDRFLYDARPSLDDEFADELYRRISSQSLLFPIQPIRLTMSPLSRSAAVAALLVALLLASSTNVRAQVRAAAEGIGQMLQAATSQLVGNMIVVDTLPSEMDFSADRAIQVTPVEFPVAELDQVFTTHISLPAWAPAECELDQTALTFQGDPRPSAMLSWACGSATESWQIFLTVHRAAMVGHFPPGSYQEYDLDNTQALVVYGQWYYDGTDFEWVTGTTSIYWDRNHHLYELTAPSLYVTYQDLLKMADSAN